MNDIGHNCYLVDSKVTDKKESNNYYEKMVFF